MSSHVFHLRRLLAFSPSLTRCLLTLHTSSHIHTCVSLVRLWLPRRSRELLELEDNARTCDEQQPRTNNNNLAQSGLEGCWRPTGALKLTQSILKRVQRSKSTEILTLIDLSTLHRVPHRHGILCRLHFDCNVIYERRLFSNSINYFHLRVRGEEFEHQLD